MIVFILLFVLVICILLYLFIIPKSKKRPQFNSSNSTSTPYISEDSPCEFSILSNNEMCKRKIGDDCITSAECSTNNFCFIGSCTSKPVTWDECFHTTCNDGMICIDRHYLFLVHSKFIMLPGWWVLKDCIDICDSPFSNCVYVLRDSGLYLCSIPLFNPITTSNKPSVSISPNHTLLKYIAPVTLSGETSDFIRIFIYRNTIHALSKDGIIYRGLSNRQVIRDVKESNYQSQSDIGSFDKSDESLNSSSVTSFEYSDTHSEWEWEKVDFINGRDISHYHISDFTIAVDGTMALTLFDGGRLIHNGKSWIEQYYNPNFKPPVYSTKTSYSTSHDLKINPNPQIKYGSHEHHFLTLHNGLAKLYLDSDQPLYTIDKVLDAIIHPFEPSTLIVIKSNGSIKRCRSTENSIVEDYIQSTQHPNQYLRSTSHGIWLLTSQHCFSM